MQSVWFSALLAASLLILSACGGAPAEARNEPAAATAPPVDPATLGSISGKIAFTGPKPKPMPLSMDATPACGRQHKGPVYAEDAVINSNGTLRNAFVYIKAGLPQGAAYPPPATPVKLDQAGCIYTPRVLGVMVNQTLEIHNSDDVNHNVHPMPKINREWNESQPPKGAVKIKSFPAEEVPPILFKCNVHPWMRAWVGVVSHPFFAVTNEDGTFTLKDLPPGDYTLAAWHERFGVQEVSIKVEPKQNQTADFTFQG